MTIQPLALRNEGDNIRVVASTQLLGSAGGGGVADHGALTGLADNDHPQYVLVTDAAELIRDTIGAALVAGSNITINVNDAGNTITITGPDLSSYLTSSAAPELIRDTIGTALVAGAGITVTVNDVGDTITLASSITQYTDEQARDAIGSALVAGSNITITVNDAGDTITIASTGGGTSNLWGAGDEWVLPAGTLNSTWAGASAWFSSNASNSSQQIIENIFDLGQAGGITDISLHVGTANAGVGAAIAVAAYSLDSPFGRTLIGSLGTATIGTTGQKTISFSRLAVPRFVAIHYALISLDTAGTNPLFANVSTAPIRANSGNPIGAGNNAPLFAGGRSWAGGSSITWPTNATVSAVGTPYLMAALKGVA
jgi:hypothetical protein